MSNSDVFFESGPIRLSWDVLPGVHQVDVCADGRVVVYTGSWRERCDYTLGYTLRDETPQTFRRPQPKPEPPTLPKEVWVAIELLHGQELDGIAMDSTGEAYAYTLPCIDCHECHSCEGWNGDNITRVSMLDDYHPRDDWRNSLVLKPETFPIDWSLVPEKYDWLAMDSNGEAYAYLRHPQKCLSKWWTSAPDYDCLYICALDDYCERENWRDSLLKRPGV